MGRFGNQLFQYAFARGYAEAHGCDFECQEWIGSRIFMLDDKPLSADRKQVSEEAIGEDAVDVNFLCYAQKQECLDFYSREKVKEWFRLRPEIEDALRLWKAEVVWHFRRGDYWNAGYPIIGEMAYINAMKEYGIPFRGITIVSDEFFEPQLDLPEGLSFLNDFYVMANADVLFRANSSFSWWAAALGRCKVYSPVIDGLVAGQKHDFVQFVEGNHPRPAQLPFITDLHLK